MKTLLAVIMVALLSTSGAWAKSSNEAIEVRIVTDSGRILPTYPVKIRQGMSKVYAEAIKGEQYKIEVKNRLNRRVGVVIAVDGRNIISGGKSWLKNSERMYILEPYGSGEFAGWRSDQERINRFYFTDVPDTYAAAFGDGSAMGVIAVAAYPEVRRPEPPQMQMRSSFDSNTSDRSAPAAAPAQAPSAEQKAKKSARAEKTMESAGTGYGRSEYSPTYIVEFEPEKRAVNTAYIKYESRSTLCRLGVVDCGNQDRRPHNRLWDNNGYAPPPPGR